MKLASWPRKHKWLFVLIIAVLAVGGFFVYEKVALELNRHAFQQASHAIDTIYADIVAQVGQPDNFRRSSQCSRPNQEFEQGPLSCYMDIDFTYGLEDQAEGVNLNNKIKNIIAKHPDLLKPTPEPPSDIQVTPAPSNYSDSALYWYKSDGGLQCTYGYAYDNPNKTHLKLLDTHAMLKTFYGTVGCAGNAKNTYYSLQ